MNVVNSIEITQEQVTSIASFLSKIPGVTQLNCDDPLDGVKGILAFYQKFDDKGIVTEDTEIWLTWRITNKPKITTFGRNSSLAEAEVAMRKCLETDGFEKCDNPKELFLGFVKNEPVGSDKESEAFMFNIGIVKQMAEEIRKLLDEWRTRK